MGALELPSISKIVFTIIVGATPKLAVLVSLCMVAFLHWRLLSVDNG